MRVEVQSFLGILTNVDDSICLADFGQGFKVRKRSVRRIMQLVVQLDQVPEHSVQVLFEGQYNCVTPDGKGVYILEGKARIPTIIGAQATDEEWNRIWYAEQAFHQEMARRVSLMRLFKDGAINLVASYLYRLIEGVLERESSISSAHQVEVGSYSLTTVEAEQLHDFLAEQEFPFTLPYIQLAYENFEQSYTEEDLKLKYLLLMIAAEVLFNDGPQELRYRISRGTAVLLGDTADEGRQIFRTMRQLYDKRSLLVHTGTAAGLSMDDVRQLRSLVRRAIVRLSALRLSKEQLSEHLTSAGFGTLDPPIKAAT
jgi:hypothetical protein